MSDPKDTGGHRDDTTRPEVGPDGYPLQSPIVTGSVLASDNRALRDLCGRLLFQLESTAKVVPFVLVADAKRLGVPQLGRPCRDSARVAELIGLAGG